ncbi:MAG: response regulator transcription factor [Betaproteobacteria bacterium]|nr:response regulator transcription factor [Betaproteobacteria bacterium]
MNDGAEPLVSVVDDDEALRDSLRWLLESAGHKVAGYASAEQFLAAYDPAQAGCLVLDIRMPGMSGLELQDELVRRGHPIPVIFITGHGDVPTAVSALKKGAIEFIEKPFHDQSFLALIDNALAYDAEVRVEAAKKVSLAVRFSKLTSREREVMERIIAGRRNKEIADELEVSIKTVEAHRAKIMEKTGAGSLAELVQFASDHGAQRRG